MNHSVLKKIGLLFLIICLIGNFSVFAQDKDDNHFIYIQAKNKQPFYVILNRKVFSSSSIGYLIIPKLQDGTYNLRIGFPKQDAPEQNYSCVISGSDMGYSLQKNDNGDLGLLNLQTKSFIASKGNTTLEDQYAANTPKKTTGNDKERIAKNESANNAPANNAFGQMLSGAINDPTLNKKVNNTPPPADLSKPEQKNTTHEVATMVNSQDQANNTQETPATNFNSTDLQDDSQTYGVIKSNEKSTDKGTRMTFVLFNSRSTDTISVLVPSSSNVSREDNVVSSPSVTTTHSNESSNNGLALFSGNSSSVATTTDGEDIPVKKRRKKKFVDINANQSDQSSNTASGKTVDNPFFNKSTEASNSDEANTSDAAVVDNSTATTNCDNPLSDKEFNKMQKKMVAKSNDDQMIAIVDKYINGKCVTTQQVKQLGGLFLSDAGRFALYQDAYSHVADKENYNTLQNQLLDTYFKNRFLKMLK